MPGSLPTIVRQIPDLNSEFLNALASVHALSEILRDNPGIDPRQKQRFIDIILAETRRMSAMVGRLTAVAGHMRLEIA